MANPITYGGSQPNKATAPVAGVNALAPAVPRQKNTFFMPYQFLSTENFADIMPFFVMDCVPNDDVRLKSNIDQRPQSTFASPLMSDIRKHRAVAAIPKSVIFPNLWSKMFVNPKKGDDVNFDNVNSMFNPRTLYSALFTSLSGVFSNALESGDIISANSSVKSSLQCLYLMKLAFSNYSLLPYLQLGITGNQVSVEYLKGRFGYPTYLTTNYVGTDFEVIENLICDFFVFLSNYYTSDGTSPFYGFRFTVGVSNLSRDFILVDNVDGDGSTIPRTASLTGLADMFEWFHYRSFDDDLTIQFLVKSSSTDEFSAVNSLSAVSGSMDAWADFNVKWSSFASNFVNYPINIQRVIAFQMGIAQFFTSDDVDYIYTSELWYQNMFGIMKNLLSEKDFSFSYNGLNLNYEPYSGAIISKIISYISSTATSPEDFSIAFGYFINLFEIPSSLRYGDMFNAARLTPLAVGDVSAPVSSNSISAVDMTKATLMQRFLNVVNSVRNTVRGYAMSLFGVVPDDVPIEPKFVAHDVKSLGASLVANTAEDQGNLETNLVLHSSDDLFDIHVNQDTILIGYSWYDCLTSYPVPLSPFALHVDRFDDFNPMLQNIGDVPVLNALMTPVMVGSSPSDQIFGYLQNDYEYKQNISYAVGGYVVGSLPSWAFIRRYSDLEIGLSSTDGGFRLTPEFIRNYNKEFDYFYKSLTGFGVTRFHFVCSYVNEVTASRPMNYISSILFNSAL